MWCVDAVSGALGVFRVFGVLEFLGVLRVFGCCEKSNVLGRLEWWGWCMPW